MELFLKQQFELLLQDATGNFAERIVHRCHGPEAALDRLASDPEENLLDNAGGYCFVLEALERRTLPADPGGPVGDVLARLATAAFADVLSTMTSQLIQRQQIYS
jgi:hypothetical protein